MYDLYAIPKFLIYPPPPCFPLVTMTVFYVCESIYVLYIHSSIWLFYIPHVSDIIYLSFHDFTLYDNLSAVLCLVTQWCPTLCDPIDCSLPSSSIHGIFQARILEWVSISFFRGSSQLRGRTHILLHLLHCRWILYHWATAEAFAQILAPLFSGNESFNSHRIPLCLSFLSLMNTLTKPTPLSYSKWDNTCERKLGNQ